MNSKVFKEIKELVSLKHTDQNWMNLVEDVGKFIYSQYFATGFKNEFPEKLINKEIFSVCEDTLFLVAQIDRWRKMIGFIKQGKIASYPEKCAQTRNC